MNELKPIRVSRSPADLAARLGKLLDEMEGWCERLEGIADRLPENVEGSECLLVSNKLSADIRVAHEFEEEIFAILRRDHPAAGRLEQILNRLHAEHLEDESFADEIRECMAEFAIDRENCNVESLAYMLRGFFESKRRHCAFEREYLLPLLLGKTN